LLKALLKEVELHVLVAPPQKQVYLDPMPFSEPLGRLFGLKIEVVFTGAYLYLDRLGLGGV
jgi:hypothetical protein